MYKKFFGFFLYWRLLLYIPLLVAHLVLPLRKGYEYTLLHFYIKTVNPLNHFLLSPFVNFDAIYYMLIAATGYTVNAGFFPLFPFLTRLLTLPFSQNDPFSVAQYIVAFFIVSVATLASMVLLYKLVRLDFSKEAGIESVVALLFFPTAFFFATFYSESTFLLLTLCAFFFARRKQWFLTGLFGALLTATRIVGIAILPALLWEWYLWFREKRRSTASIASSLVPVLLTPLGLIIYMLYSAYKWHDALFFVHAQGSLANNRSVSHIVLLPQTFVRYGRIFMTVSGHQFEFWIALLEVAAVLFGIVFLFLAWKKKIRTSYLIFSVIAFLIPASTGTFTGMPRYVLVCFPIFIAVALLGSKKLRFALYIIFFFLQLILFMLFAKGYFIA